MKIYPYKSFDELQASAKNIIKGPIALTIGNFDGVHKGHLAVLKQLIEKKKHTVVFSFMNHPAEVLHQKTIPWLTTSAHRLDLLEKEGIESLILIPFDLPFSRLSAEEFVQELKRVVPFSSLVLGYDAVIGHQRKGDEKILSFLGKKYQFSVEHVKPVLIENQVISSSIIRKSIQEGNLKLAERFLGRPFSVKASVNRGVGKGKALGFRTANLQVANHCLPPLGVWIVKVKLNAVSAYIQGVANLGVAPTAHENRALMLEVHLLDFEQDLYDQVIEVVFLKHVREEKRFDSLESLKNQIKNDIALARGFFQEEKTSA